MKFTVFSFFFILSISILKAQQNNLMILEFDLVFLFTTKVKNTMFQNLQVVL